MKILFALFVPCFFACARVSAAEPAKESEHDQQQIAALAKELQTQQTAIAENQTKINEKLVAIAEALRQAKIFATRSR